MNRILKSNKAQKAIKVIFVATLLPFIWWGMFEYGQLHYKKGIDIGKGMGKVMCRDILNRCDWYCKQIKEK